MIIAIHDAIQVAHMTNFPLSYILVEANTVMRSPILQSPNMGRLQTVSPDSPDIQTVLINSIDNAN